MNKKTKIAVLTKNFGEILPHLDFQSIDYVAEKDAEDQNEYTVVISRIDEQFINPHFNNIVYIAFGRQDGDLFNDDIMHKFVEHWMKDQSWCREGVKFEIVEFYYDPTDLDKVTVN